MRIISVDRRTLAVLLSTDENSECNDCYCYDIFRLVDGSQSPDSLTTQNDRCDGRCCFCYSNLTDTLLCRLLLFILHTGWFEQ